MVACSHVCGKEISAPLLARRASRPVPREELGLYRDILENNKAWGILLVLE